MAADDVPPLGLIVICPQCGEPYEQTGRSNGGWFHYTVVATVRLPDGRIRITGHWRAGDWIEGAPLVLRARDGRRVTIVEAEMEPPINSACEARAQRRLIVPDLGRFELNGCIHAMR